MDFDLDDEQQAVSDLAGRILGDLLPAARLTEIEARPDGFANEAWSELAKADLIGIALPESDGGGGYGILEACLVLEQVGRTVAPVPYLATVVLGALPIARFGSTAQRAALPEVVAGELRLTAALCEAGGATVPSRPQTEADGAPGAWRLRGEKTFVPDAHLARFALVPARTGDGDASTVFLVDLSAPGVDLVELATTAGSRQSILRLDGVEVDERAVVGDVGGGSEVVRWMVDRATAAVCSTQAGVCEAALRMTASYTSERQQFDSPLATFQAVAHRAADAFIDTTGVQLTSRVAAWRLSRGLPADDELDVAKFWAADAGQRVVHAAQHLHGGIGVDKDWPLHRYFLWAKELELTLGGASEHLRSLGSRLAGAEG